METQLAGLNIYTALLSRNPIMLHRQNLEIELLRKREEAEWRDDYLNDTVLDSTTFHELERLITYFTEIKKYALDIALNIVLNQKGLDYWKQYSTLSAALPTSKPSFMPASISVLTPRSSPETGNTLPSDVLADLLNFAQPRDATQTSSRWSSGPRNLITNESASAFKPINRQEAKRPFPISPPGSISDTEAVPNRKLKQAKVEVKTRTTLRLLPHEAGAEGKSRRPDHERFCWNVPYWLEDRIGKDLKTDYHGLEDFAAGLFHPSATPGCLKDSEKAFLVSPDVKVNPHEYRSLRARILIGCAMIFEHNLRGSMLNERIRVHPVCRPSLEQPFRYSRIGRAQAQLLGCGSDVAKSSRVFDECLKAKYIPETTDMPPPTSSLLYQPTAALEQCFPTQVRQRLYQDLENWYAGRRTKRPAIPADLRFVISARYLQDSPHHISPPAPSMTTDQSGALSAPEEEEAGARRLAPVSEPVVCSGGPER